MLLASFSGLTSQESRVEEKPPERWVGAGRTEEGADVSQAPASFKHRHHRQSAHYVICFCALAVPLAFHLINFDIARVLPCIRKVLVLTMAIPLGAIAYSAADTEPAGEHSISIRLPNFLTRKAASDPKSGPSSGSTSPRESTSSFKKPSRSPSRKLRTGKKHQKSLSGRGANKRVRAELTPSTESFTSSFDNSSRTYLPSGDTLGQRLRRKAALEPSEASARSSEDSRAKHIPIVVPGYDPLARDFNEARAGSVSTLSGGSSSSPSTSDFPVTPNYQAVTGRDNLVGRDRPRHVEIRIPSWAQPIVKQPSSPPRLHLSHQSVFVVDPFTDVGALSSPTMSRPTPDYSRTSTMDSSSLSNASPGQLYANELSSGSQAHLSSANSSQSSLVGMRAEYESASEAESSHDDGLQSSAHAAGSSALPNSQTPNMNSTANLSGLVCNVHRTTGKEPHPLVGATTTILGDKLYVFGGRRLSRTKPQLTSNLYELDLIRRHWTKLNVQGDIPAARYFHSVCPLGDTKLVCYGGMSPAPIPADAPPDTQPEIIVMSDIHIFDVTTNTWTKVSTSDSPQGRYAHCAAVLPSAAVFASAHAPTSALHHNPQGSNPNEGTLGVSIDGTGGAEMIVVGGQDSANHYIEQVSVFNFRSLKWTGTTGMGRSCGAYRSVVTPLTTLSASQIGAGPHSRNDVDNEDEDTDAIGSSAPMLIYSNYNFLDVKLELQVRLTDGTLTEKPMQTTVSPPGLRFPNGGVIDNHFVVSGTFLTSSKQEYALWALDLRTLSWSRIDAGGSIFSQGSWNRGVLWNRRNAFVILGNRKRSLVDDYNNRRTNFSNMCVVELEAFGLYDNPRRAEPTSSYVSASALPTQIDAIASGRRLSPAAEELGSLALNVRELADMDFLAIDGTRIPVNSRLIARRWGWHFTSLFKESLIAAAETDTVTLRATGGGNPTRNSTITITPSVTSGGTTLTNNSQQSNEIPDTRSAPPPVRPRLFYLPHTAPTLQALLHYLYTSTLPSAPSNLATPQIFCSLLQLARPYKIDGLLEAVVERLHESLDGRNAAAIFNAAAMGAGGGEGVLFAAETRNTARESTIPIRTASLAGLEALNLNGGRGGPSLRVDTDVANGRTTRNTVRPGTGNDTDDEVPDSAVTEDSMSESEASLSARSFTGRADRDREVWNGAMSSVVGLQKRGLRGLMEGRRMRERGRSDGLEGQRVGLGIA